MVVQPIADEQARGYLVAHLEARGESLYARLDERLRAMAHTPLILWLIKEAGKAVSWPKNAIHEGFVQSAPITQKGYPF